MQYLPKIDYTAMDTPSKCYSLNDDLQYKELQEIISEHIEGDCWAVTINDEILYNSYEPKSPRDKILDSLVRNELTENIHRSLFVELIRVRQDGKVVLYMFGTHATWFMVIYYSAIRELFTVEYYKTLGYDKLIDEGNARRALRETN
jgi:hypothetical protein